MAVMRTQAEIDDALDKAETNNGRWPGMTFEEGVSAALRWVSGYTDDHPMEDDGDT